MSLQHEISQRKVRTLSERGDYRMRRPNPMTMQQYWAKEAARRHEALAPLTPAQRAAVEELRLTTCMDFWGALNRVRDWEDCFTRLQDIDLRSLLSVGETTK